MKFFCRLGCWLSAGTPEVPGTPAPPEDSEPTAPSSGTPPSLATPSASSSPSSSSPSSLSRSRFTAPMSSTALEAGKLSCARITGATSSSAAAAIAASMLGEGERSSSSSFAEAAAIAASTSLSTTFGKCRTLRPALSTIDSRSVRRATPTPSSSSRRTDIPLARCHSR